MTQLVFSDTTVNLNLHSKQLCAWILLFSADKKPQMFREVCVRQLKADNTLFWRSKEELNGKLLLIVTITGERLNVLK